MILFDQHVLTQVEKGVLTDKELEAAIHHYTQLEELLLPHGDKYRLVWGDVINTLHTLQGFKIIRNDPTF